MDFCIILYGRYYEYTECSVFYEIDFSIFFVFTNYKCCYTFKEIEYEIYYTSSVLNTNVRCSNFLYHFLNFDRNYVISFYKNDFVQCLNYN